MGEDACIAYSRCSRINDTVEVTAIFRQVNSIESIVLHVKICHLIINFKTHAEIFFMLRKTTMSELSVTAQIVGSPTFLCGEILRCEVKMTLPDPQGSWYAPYNIKPAFTL